LELFILFGRARSRRSAGSGFDAEAERRDGRSRRERFAGLIVDRMELTAVDSADVLSSNRPEKRAMREYRSVLSLRRRPNGFRPGVANVKILFAVSVNVFYSLIAHRFTFSVGPRTNGAALQGMVSADVFVIVLSIPDAKDDRNGAPHATCADW